MLVRYTGLPLWHERLVVGEAPGGRWVVATPDAYLFYNRRTVNRDISAKQEERLLAEGRAYLESLLPVRGPDEPPAPSQVPRFRLRGNGARPRHGLPGRRR